MESSGNSQKYSWADIRQAVNDLRREMSTISNMVPMNITFKRLSKHKYRVFFLRSPQNGWEITLLYTEIAVSDQPSKERLEWFRLMGNGSRGPNLNPPSSLRASSTSPQPRWSREEQLLRERQRAPAWGITAYELHRSSDAIVFPAASALFLVDSVVTPARPRVVPTCLWGAPLTPALWPGSSTDLSSILIAHASRRDLWLASPSLVATRLTYASNGSPKLADDPLQAGVPSYVTQEEFSRYTGFWWQPKSNDNVYRIVYEEVDESDVKIFTFPSSFNSNGDSEEFRFPRAGTPNARSTLRMLEFRLGPAAPHGDSEDDEDEGYDGYRMDMSDDSDFYGGKHSAPTLEVQALKWFDLTRSISEAFPWCEYIPRVGWTPCGQFVWAQLLDRPQQRLDLVLIHVEDFSERFIYPSRGSPQKSDASVAHDVDTIYDVDDGDIWYYKQVLISESAPNAWVNVHDVLHFLPSTYGHVSFIWASEETGFLHLYKVVCSLAPPVTKQQRLAAMMEDSGNSSMLYAATYGPSVVSKVALTYGDWEVVGRKIWVDEQRELVYFMGLRETPLERHLYCVSYGKHPGTVKLITKPGYSYSVDIDEECIMATITRSSVSQAPYCGVFRLKHDNPSLVPQVPSLTLLPAGILMHPEFSFVNGQDDQQDLLGSPMSSGNGLLHSIVPTLHARRLGGATEPCYAMLWRPVNYEPGRRYPTVLHVYGGPEVQTVTNAYKGMRQLRMAILAARGFCVVTVDSRGSKHRGLKWEAAIRGKMGQVEIDDQVEMLQWLAAETGCIDLTRVGVHGWSYGGYLSLLALATRPDVFKACVAGAPVTCWLLYDTAYTERYMGVPPINPSMRDSTLRPSQQHAATTDHASYRRASVLVRAEDFPDEENRLLIIHGLVDENVHFAHTAALIAALVKAGKPHRVQLYPGERHSLRRHDAARHYETQLLAFLHEVL